MVIDDELEIVRFALALHLNIDPEEIDERQTLDEELGLDPLDLVLVVLRLEEIGQIEFPVADLEGIRTVGDLTNVVRSWCRLEPLSRKGASRPTESGFHVVDDLPVTVRWGGGRRTA